VIGFADDNWRLEYPIGKVLLDGQNWISDARISPDGKQVALFKHPPNQDDRGEVVVVDRSGHLRSLSAGWESLEGLAWAPSGKEIWFSAAESGEQYCIHAVALSGSQRTVYCGTAPTRIHDISSSGRSLLSTEEHRVTMATAEHGSSEERDLSWLDNPYGPRLSHDGSEILFTDLSEQAGNGYAAYVRKSDGSPAVRIGQGGFGADLSPDGKWALIVLPGDPAQRVQIVPVGPGQARVLHWEGVDPIWACWFPDGQHILIGAGHSGKAPGSYVTDVNGSAPKLVAPDRIEESGVAPDGHSLLILRNGDWVVVSAADGNSRPAAGLQPEDFPIAWASDSEHIFVQVPNPTGFSIYKVDLVSGKRELWQTVTPKDQVGLRLTNSPTAITPDGRWMAFTYGNQLGQLYRSDTLK